MSPHATQAETSDTDSPKEFTNGTHIANGKQTNSFASSHKSQLRRYDDDEVHDLVCVGFGPASLAVAVALHDALEDGMPHLRTDEPKVRFLERQQGFAWHAGMLLPGAKMQISFIKDLATLRNPRSQFTFMNYLHHKNRLVQFANLGTFLPQRIEYEDYMKWCAGWFKDVVDYGRDVQSVEVGETDPDTGAARFFAVTSQDRKTGRTSALKAKHVVIAAGGRPNIPDALALDHPRIIHSSQYHTSISDLYPSGKEPRSVAVIGAGQSAAEVFNNISTRFPGSKAYLLIRGAALRPSDDSPFVNEVFDPDRVDDVFSQDPKLREQAIARDKATNYSVVRLELLEHIYSMLYSYRIQYASEEEWPQRILNHRDVIGIKECVSDGVPALRLNIQNGSDEHCARKTGSEEKLTVDLVIVASGYRRDAHEEMLQGIRRLMPGGDRVGQRWSVRRDYGVEFENGSVQPDAGIWLQGCNEATHGLSDTLLSILANRGGEMVNNIFAETVESAMQAKRD